MYVVFRKALFIGGVLGMATLLFFFNPEETIWLPKCAFFMLTGYQCPSCGGQRAVYSLLHGHINEALGYNPFLVISIPYAFAIVLAWLVPEGKLRRLNRFCFHPATVYVYLIVMVGWWVIRNINF